MLLEQINDTDLENYNINAMQGKTSRGPLGLTFLE